MSELNGLLTAARRQGREAAIVLSKRRVWYADETPPATPAQAQPTPQTPTPELQPSGADDSGEGDGKPKVFDEAYVKELRKEAAKHRTEARELKERLEALEKGKQADEEKKLADQQEWQKLAEKRAGELESLKQQHATEMLNIQRENVAARYADRLVKPADPDVDPVAEFAKRLQGKNVEELRADAERLIALFGVPQAAAKTEGQQQPSASNQARSQQTTTAVPGGQPVGRTDADRKGQYYGNSAQQSPIFQGGKVVYHGNPDDLG